MSGAVSPLPSTPPWRGAQLKHRDSFYLVFLGVELKICAFLTSPLDSCEFSVSYTLRLNPEIIEPQYPLGRKLGESKDRSEYGGGNRKKVFQLTVSDFTDCFENP
jgi:hypothetical protein